MRKLLQTRENKKTEREKTTANARKPLKNQRKQDLATENRVQREKTSEHKNAKHTEKARKKERKRETTERQSMQIKNEK